MKEIKNRKKIDLHCHLDGSLSVETLRKLAGNLGQKLPPEEELLARVQAGKECENLKEYLDCFTLPLSYLCTEQNFTDAAMGVLRDAAEENVVYMEVRFSPLQSGNSGLSCGQIIEAVLRGLRQGRETCGVISNLILCGMRHLPVEKNLEMLRCARGFLGEGVCGVDMAGNEAACPILGQKAFFEEAKRLGLPFTIHAGECGDPESVRNAIALGAKRIGHGIAAVKAPGLMEELRKKRIALELCPTSNLQTRAVPSKEAYPFEIFRREGLLLTVNTDNRMVSGTSLTQEFEWLQHSYHLTKEDMDALTENALEASFADEETKQEIMASLR